MKSRVYISRMLNVERTWKIGNAKDTGFEARGISPFHATTRPLKTQKIRVAEEQERMKKYPKTTIRVRFPDSTMLQATFKSSERGINIDKRRHCVWIIDMPIHSARSIWFCSIHVGNTQSQVFALSTSKIKIDWTWIDPLQGWPCSGIQCHVCMDWKGCSWTTWYV